jgi:hypothetical protein
MRVFLLLAAMMMRWLSAQSAWGDRAASVARDRRPTMCLLDALCHHAAIDLANRWRWRATGGVDRRCLVVRRLAAFVGVALFWLWVFTLALALNETQLPI